MKAMFLEFKDEQLFCREPMKKFFLSKEVAFVKFM